MRAIFTGALFAAAAMLGAAPSSAQVRLSLENGNNYNVQVMSWWEIPFRSVVRQRYDFSCGSAAVATLLRHHFGVPANERAAFVSMWKLGNREAIRKSGFSMLDMKLYLGSLGYRAEGFRFDPKQLPKIKRPLIMLLDLNGYKHFVVLKGVRGNKVMTGDPMLGLRSYDIDEFGKYWNGVALAVVETPDGRRASFDLTSDWAPWATAPLREDRELRAATSDLTTYLPPVYQLSPQLLLDVRVGTVP